MQNPLVALVYSRQDATRNYLKLLRPGRNNEVNILVFLAKFDHPDNHAIWPVVARTCENGTLLLLPDAGVCVSDYKHLRTQLVSIVGQFLRGVAFLHEHGVAHCDLKPANLVVNQVTGSATLIDFDLAVRGLDWLDGFTGTNGWTAPEVGQVPRYNPMQADVWSAGKVLRTLALDHPLSNDREFLLGLGEDMMANDSIARPSMKDVIERFDRYIELTFRAGDP